MLKKFARTLPADTYFLVLLAFIYLPVVTLVLFSFQSGDLPVPPFDGPSLRWYERAFANERLMGALLNSLLVAFVSSAIAATLGFAGAYSLFRHRPRGQKALRFILMVPLTVSYLIIALGLLVVFSLLGVPKSLITVGIGHVIINLPICFSIIYSQFGDQYRNIDNAAHDLGASDLQTIIHVIAPVMIPSILAAFCLSVTLSWDEFVIAFLLSSFDVTLPVIIFEMLRAGLTPEVNAAGTIVFGISMCLAVFAALFILFGTRRRT